MKSKLKINQIKIITNGLLFPICHLAPSQVRSTNTFKQYKSNPFNGVEKLFFFFLVKT